MNWKKLEAGVVLIGLAFVISHRVSGAPAAAAELGGEQGWRFVFTHMKTLALKDARGPSPTLESGKPPKTFLLRPEDGPSCVQVKNPNPVLFKYMWKQKEVTKSENYQAAASFAEVLALFVTNLGAVKEAEAWKENVGKAALPGNPEKPKEPLTTSSVRRALSAQGADRKSLTASLGAALETPAVQSRVKVNEALQAVGIPNSVTFLDEVEANLEDLAGRLKAMERGLAALAKEGGRLTPGDFREGLDLVDLEKKLTEVFKKVDAGRAALWKLVLEDEPGLAEEPFFVGSTLLQDQRSVILESARKVVLFEEALRSMESPLFLGTVDYSSKENQDWSLNIEVVDGNTAGRGKPEQVAGDFSVRFVPYSPVKLGVGAAVIYSFVGNEKYGTRAVEGGFEIIEEPDQEQYQAEGIAAVLTITPRGWTDPTFGGFFEIGVQPTDRLGLLAGAGIRLYDLVSFGAGVAFQQVDVLGPGLEVEENIATESDLKTVRRFKAGVYLHLTIAFDVKK